MATEETEARADYRALVKSAVLDEKSFVGLTLSGKLRDDGTPWVSLRVRPVEVQGKRALQFGYSDSKRWTTRNYSGADVAARLDEALAIPFGNLHVQSAAADLHIRITRKGKVLVTRGKASSPGQAPLLAHDRVKDQPLAAGVPDPLLQAIGIEDAEGRIRPSMRAKHRQVNEFLRVIDQVLLAEGPPAGALQVVDCGCGLAYLTFAAYHYLNHVRGAETRLVGIDKDRELIEKCGRLRDSLGWPGPQFCVSGIAEFGPESPPDAVLSLHACDTATDEAIAQGIRWQSRVILAVPCCQHELHRLLEAPVFRPLLAHGILRERLADLLTDTFRALALRIMGYRTSVVEFVAPEHTARNLMIRAERVAAPGAADPVREYGELKRFWNVTPSIEALLGDDLRRWL